MKKIYMVQACDTHGADGNESAYLPYATGLLVACAFENPVIASHYDFGRFIYKKEDINAAVNSLVEPAVVGFSTYIWNNEYNKEFARRLKEKYPSCVTVFGGHNVSDNSPSQLDEMPYADILIHGEGEITFRELLLALDSGGPLSAVEGISYRTPEGKAVINPPREACEPCFPSPYLGGWFDSIIEQDKTVIFSALIETNRGCPYHCAYCDWGSSKNKLRLFPLERVTAEIEWLAKKKIAFLFCTDSNFGMFDRDFDIVDAFMKIKAATGYPETFKCCTTEGGGMKEFEINKKLSDCGLLKGASFAMQTLCPEALKNIGRRNMPLEKYAGLTGLYNRENIPTYSELIYGLPGETYDSFADNLCRMLDFGTTKGCFIHYCELLINSALALPENTARFGIKTMRIPYTQFHCRPETSVREYSNIIVSTYSMDNPSWIKTVRLGLFVQCFHYMGLMQYAAKYLRYEEGVPFREFYEKLIGFALENPGTVIGRNAARVTANLSGENGSISRVYADAAFGGIEYPMEEGMCLDILTEPGRFYDEISAFVLSLAKDKSAAGEVLAYQRASVRNVDDKNKTACFGYDFPSYFNALNLGLESHPEKKQITVDFVNTFAGLSLPEYAMRVVWYGRKAGLVMYSSNETSVRLP